jgi:hypothetical protein
VAVKPSRWWAATLLVAGLVAGGWFALDSASAGGEKNDPGGDTELGHTATQRLIFVAILDGLFEDGVGSEIEPVLKECPSCEGAVGGSIPK